MVHAAMRLSRSCHESATLIGSCRPRILRYSDELGFNLAE